MRCFRCDQQGREAELADVYAFACLYCGIIVCGADTCWDADLKACSECAKFVGQGQFREPPQTQEGE